MNTSENTTNIIKAMISAAPEVSSISKNKQAYGYKYATLDSLIDMLRNVLPKHGLWFMQMPTRDGEKSTLTTRVFHESGEWFEDSIEMTDTELQGKANDTQKLGASITYFRRYALASIFGVSADEDVDGNINSRPSQAKQTSYYSQPTKQKLDPAQYVSADFTSRLNAGETKESILECYAQMISKDYIGSIDGLSDNEVKAIATSIYMSNKQRMAQ